MACGCKGGSPRKNSRNTPALAPKPNLTSTKTPAELRNTTTNRSLSPNGMDAARKAKEAERRAAIRRALGKG